MVYEYIVGRHRTSQSPTFTYCPQSLQYAPLMIYRSGNINHKIRYPFALLSTSTQIRDEALDILYSQNTFHIKLNQGCFDGYWHVPWKLDSITKLAVEFAYNSLFRLGWRWDELDQAKMRDVRWDLLRRMSGLRSVRMFVSAGYTDGLKYWPTKPRSVFDSLLIRSPREAVVFRQMMRDFVASIPPSVTEVEFGLEEAGRATQKLFYDTETLDAGYKVFVPAAYMQQRYEEFKSLQSSDVGL